MAVHPPRPKWAVYCSTEALDAQARFFDHFLRGEDTGITEQPPVRVEIREDRTTVAEVRHVDGWPPPDTQWRTLRCRAGRQRTAGALDDADESAVPGEETVTLGLLGRRASFTHRFATDTEVVGPMLLTLTLSVEGAEDFPVLAGVRKFRNGKEVTFEGSYGFQGDLVTHGMLLASHRAVDPQRSLPYLPYHPHTSTDPLVAGEKVRLDIGLLPTATLFRADEELRLDVQGRWFHARDPVHGHFPVGHRTTAKGTCTLHLGPDDGCTLLIPVLKHR